jgi:hypothetical protein
MDELAVIRVAPVKRGAELLSSLWKQRITRAIDPLITEATSILSRRAATGIETGS